MTTEPQAQTSERERLIADRADWLVDAVAMATQNRMFLRGEPECDAVACEAIKANGARAMRVLLDKLDRADAEKIRALEAGRIEAQHVAQHLSLWRGLVATSRTWDRGEEVDLLGALLDKLDAAIAATQSPRSEAGEEK